MKSIRKHLYKTIACQTTVPVRDVIKVLAAAEEQFQSELKERGRVEVRGIGIFTTGVNGDKPTVFFRPARKGVCKQHEENKEGR